MTSVNTFLKQLFGLYVLMAVISCQDEPEQSTLEAKADGQLIDLSGEWMVKLDSLDTGEFDKWFVNKIEGQVINLPGTLDDAGIGVRDTLTPALNNYVLSNLVRKHSYVGKAWYQKEIDIPTDWADQKIELTLERVLWRSTLYVDSLKIGFRESLVGSHDYSLTSVLKPGRHTLTIEVDNSNLYPNINVLGNRYPVKLNQEMAHAYTNHTQIKWNGILGDATITASSKGKPENLEIYPDFETDMMHITFKQKRVTRTGVHFEIDNAAGTTIYSKQIKQLSIEGESVSFSIARPKEIEVWDEFNPNVYTARVFSKNDSAQTDFGFRKIENKDAELRLNGQRIFLRGNLECVIFPLTGYPPMKKEGWLTLIHQAQNYGLNHLRFHSWCPPKAAFEAADQAGFYLQVELPHWSLEVGEDKETTDFLKQEAFKILNDYGNHPSFILMALGNELQGDMQVLNEITAELKKKDRRHLYATTSFSFQKPTGTRPEPEDEFFVTQWTEKGWIRGQGIFNAYLPSFDADYSQNSAIIEVPLISHEIGQYSVYPDLSEIAKYKGVLKPLNFIAIRDDLEKKGMLELAQDFTFTSGKLAAMLYKEEIERALKTPSFDGFQLLQLQDFPGQGTALVGLLNAFWESKGVISGEEFRQFNSPLVPLARFEKAVYESGESFKASIELANFLKEMTHQRIRVTLKNSNHKILKELIIDDMDLYIGTNIGLEVLSLPIEVDAADVWTLEIELEGTSYRNQWPIWVFPKNILAANTTVLETQSFAEAIKFLEEGKKVLLSPDQKKIEGIQGRFVPVFWSPVHFPDQPGTMGLLIDNTHRALAEFPTETYTQWQWWDLCTQSIAVKLNELNIKPIVRVIDNFVSNNDLASLFEVKVGTGKLIFSAMDIHTNLSKRPAARHLRTSIINYMATEKFDPQQPMSREALKNLEKK